jgi:hypothetical protein
VVISLEDSGRQAIVCEAEEARGKAMKKELERKIVMEKQSIQIIYTTRVCI